MKRKASANKILLSLIIILAIILIATIILFRNSTSPTEINSEKTIPSGNQETTQQQTVTVPECDNLPEDREKWLCYTDAAEEERSLEICDKISMENYLWSCYYSVAMVKNSPGTCNLIKWEGRDYDQSCLRDLEQWKTGTCDILDRYPEEKANCLKLVAIANDNLAGCEKIEIQSYKESCIKHINLNLQE